MELCEKYVKIFGGKFKVDNSTQKKKKEVDKERGRWLMKVVK